MWTAASNHPNHTCWFFWMHAFFSSRENDSNIRGKREKNRGSSKVEWVETETQSMKTSFNSKFN